MASKLLRALVGGVFMIGLFAHCATTGNEGGCTTDDLPDPLGKDSNCDGIDGVANEAIFVAPTGSDTNIGSREAPLKTIRAGLAIAAQRKKTQVIVAGGDYDEPDTLTMPDKVGLYGGYDGASWARTSVATNVRVNKPVGMEARGLTGPNYIGRISIAASDNTNPGGAAIGIRLVSVKDFTINDNATVSAGRGGPGASGEAGMPGGNGNPGKPGGGGSIDSQSSPGAGGGPGDNPACPDAAGGNGGEGGKDPNFAGVKGSDSPLGALGGPGGSTSSCSPAGGQDGQAFAMDAENGMDGMGGAGRAKLDTMTYALLAQDGADGTDGKTGAGGGGGGGSSGQTGFNCIDGAGNGGGGGGAGGCGGTAGKGGKGGGASVAILAISSPVVIDGATLITAGGGKGGDGGKGGTGGAPGQGQIGGNTGVGEIGKGGKGGDGKKGGDGGNGGGGGGGASVGVWSEGGSVPKLMRPTMKLGEPGAGGACAVMTCAGQTGIKKETGP